MVTKRALHPTAASDPTQTLSLLLTLPTTSLIPSPTSTRTKTKYPSKPHCLTVSSRLHPTYPPSASLSPTAPRALIYLPAQKTLYPPYSDQPVPFRQLRHFYYLSGCNIPDSHLTYDLQRQKLTLYIPPLNPKEVLWTGMPKGKEELLAELDVDEVRYSDSLREDLDAWVAGVVGGGVVYCLDKKSLPPAPRGAEGVGLDEDLLGAMGWGWTSMRGVTIDTEKLISAIDDSRVFKDPHEIHLLRKAISITRQAHISVMSLLRETHAGRKPQRRIEHLNESHLEAEYTRTCISLHSRNQAYEPIVCAGRNASTLHYTQNNQPLLNKQLLLIDAGCEWENYASDITRTYPLSGTWTKEAKAIYDLVDRMQTQCIKKTVANVSWRETHFLAARIATEGLLALGIFRAGSVDEIFKAGTWRAFFPHGLGHMIGLETHDVEGTPDDKSGYDPHIELLRGIGSNTAANRRGHLPPAPGEMDSLVNRIIKPNMVLTVEPGIYFCEWIIKPYLSDPKHKDFIDKDVLEKYWDVGGVRIEDMVLVNEVGYGNEVLSKDIPRGW